LREGVMRSFMMCSEIERRHNGELYDVFRDREEA
jgi:hypothetical protein